MLYRDGSSYLSDGAILLLLVCRYGYHLSKTSYVVCEDPPTIKSIFSRIRNFEGTGSYPKTCSGIPIVHVRDVTTGYDSSQPDLRSVRCPCLLWLKIRKDPESMWSSDAATAAIDDQLTFMNTSVRVSLTLTL